MPRNFSKFPAEQQKAFRKNWKAVETFLSALQAVAANDGETRAIQTVHSMGDYAASQIESASAETLDLARQAKERSHAEHAKATSAADEAMVAYNESLKVARAAKKKEDKAAAKAVADANKAAVDAAKAALDVASSKVAEATDAHDAAAEVHAEVVA